MLSQKGDVGCVVCFPVECAQCGKMTWDGCGMHVDDALASFDAVDLCECR